MNDLKPIDLKDPRIKASVSSGAVRRRLVIGLLITIIVTAMIAWLGLLGWALFELLREVGFYVMKLWPASS